MKLTTLSALVKAFSNPNHSITVATDISVVYSEAYKKFIIYSMVNDKKVKSIDMNLEDMLKPYAEEVDSILEKWTS